MVCQNCGMKSEVQYRFCQKCGSPLGSHIGESAPKTTFSKSAGQEKLPIWRRLMRGWSPSLLVAVLMIIGGLIFCWIGYSLIENSTFLQMIDMRNSEYAGIYGRVGLTQGQWIMAILGIIINVGGIVSAYIGIVSSLDKVKPANRQNSFVAKLIAIVLCVLTFFVMVVLNVLFLDGKGKMSIWDYLILCAICKAIWRGIVGSKKTTERALSDVQKKDAYSNEFSSVSDGNLGRPTHEITCRKSDRQLSQSPIRIDSQVEIGKTKVNTIRLNCPHCKMELEAPALIEDGRRVSCPYCETRFEYCAQTDSE